MASLAIHLFGRFSVYRNLLPIEGIPGGKIRELFCYLLLERGRTLSRESISNLFWGESSTTQSKKSLRQALWQLQAILDAQGESSRQTILQVTAETARINTTESLWLDIDVFEDACLAIQSVPGAQLTPEQATSVSNALELYRGDLLEDCYQEWCLAKRGRLQNLYIASLEKLVSFASANRHFEQGLDYGEKILRIDPAHERTHQQMLSLFYYSGDRARALRQYQKCVDALDKELGISPSQRTRDLCEQIRADKLALPAVVRPISASPQVTSMMDDRGMGEILTDLRRVQGVLSEAVEHVQRDIERVEALLRKRPEAVTMQPQRLARSV